jgi:twitching motility protein PilJ
MATGNEFAQEYQRAFKAYSQGMYDQAAEIVDQLVLDRPDDPSVRLLRGHIYCYGLQQYDVAREQYNLVLNLTSDPQFIDYAKSGLEASGDGSDLMTDADQSGIAADSDYGTTSNGAYVTTDTGDTGYLGNSSKSTRLTTASTYLQEPIEDPFADPFADNTFGQDANESGAFPGDDPFAFSGTDASDDFLVDRQLGDALDDPFAGNDLVEGDGFASGSASSASSFGINPTILDFSGSPDGGTDSTYLMDDLDVGATYSEENRNYAEPTPHSQPAEESTQFMRDSRLGDTYSGSGMPSSSTTGATRSPFPDLPPIAEDDDRTFVSSSSWDGISGMGGNFSSGFPSTPVTDGSSLAADMPHADFSGSHDGGDFMSDFDEFDDLGSFSDFDLAENSQGFTANNGSASLNSSSAAYRQSPTVEDTGNSQRFSSGFGNNDRSSIPDDEVFRIDTGSDQVPNFALSDSGRISTEPVVSVEQGSLAFFENAPLQRKQIYTALITGVVTALSVAVIHAIAVPRLNADNDPKGVVDKLRLTSLITLVAAGVGGAAATYGLGQVTTRHIKRSTGNLQAQFSAISQGNLDARATVYSEDEFGQLATGFNQMSRVIFTNITESQRKVEEAEQAKEDLQRQVIRLLDDVEGAARGDLTVQAEVTADVLGAVADSFNLTIQNLRELVGQVTRAARQVNKGSADSEMFARGLSSDALRQAEELAVTLNSVQVMTESIQRVADSARQAEEVARAASATALKGGEAVESTVSGILRIRETVAETTRKVKRLAESSQEISKIVALISSIASRTNLLALNASIEAARAGEAGRGFAIVADEVRQLADRAAKASKEIEQIVLQIQSETSSVMTAMEEGTQQVIEGTRLAEQAKRSLEEIIQVSNRIDALVRSITADTVEQTETSRQVAHVMQSVELTAQETSQEAQRVSGALQSLVGVARELLNSVERFRVEQMER